MSVAVEANQQQIEAALRKLSSVRRSVRKEGEQTFRDAGTEGVANLCSYLTAAVRRRQCWLAILNLLTWGMWICSPLIVWHVFNCLSQTTVSEYLLSFCLDLDKKCDGMVWSSVMELAAILTVALLVGIPRLARSWLTRDIVSGIGVLGRHTDVRSLGTLLDTMRLSRGTVRRATYESLTSLLPRIPAEEVFALTPTQRKALLSLLQRDEPRLVCALVGLIGRAGISEAASQVGRLATGKPSLRLPTAYYPRVQAAAQQALSTAALLRPAEAGADTLMRPAQNVESESRILLRSSPPT